MLALAQSYNLYSESGSFDHAAFNREYEGSGAWALREYNPPRPLTPIWEDFLTHRAEECTWNYLCKIQLLHSSCKF